MGVQLDGCFRVSPYMVSRAPPLHGLPVKDLPLLLPEPRTEPLRAGRTCSCWVVGGFTEVTESPVTGL